VGKHMEGPCQGTCGWGSAAEHMQTWRDTLSTLFAPHLFPKSTRESFSPSRAASSEQFWAQSWAPGRYDVLLLSLLPCEGGTRETTAFGSGM
jgi:hypothetical protein